MDPIAILLYTFYFLVALIILVSVHEFGHFYVARLCGVKVLSFCIGMGRPFWSFHDKKGTKFGIAPFPLGGYVAMLGQGPEPEVSDEERHQSYAHKSVWQRIAILAAGPVANFILAIFIFWGLAVIQGKTEYKPMIGSVEPGSLADLAGVEPNQTIVGVDGYKVVSRQDVLERLMRRLGESGPLSLSLTSSNRDIEYEVEVPLVQWLKGVKDPDPIAGLGIGFFNPPIKISEVVEDSAATDAGLQVGDVLMGVDGQDIHQVHWVRYIEAHPGVPIRVRLDRNGSELELAVTPRKTLLEDGREVGRIGIGMVYAWPEGMKVTQSYGVLGGFVKSFQETWNTAKNIYVGIEKLIVGEISTKNLSGPIGIAKVAGDHAKAGLGYFVTFLAILSVYLGVLNLLPIPVLDGGHILNCLIEAVKGSPVSEKVQALSYSVGLAVLAGVMVVAFYNDILRF